MTNLIVFGIDFGPWQNDPSSGRNTRCCLNCDPYHDPANFYYIDILHSAERFIFNDEYYQSNIEQLISLQNIKEINICLEQATTFEMAEEIVDRYLVKLSELSLFI